MELTAKERYGRELHAAVQANNPFLLRHLVRGVQQDRVDLWHTGRGGVEFPTLDYRMGPQGITAFQLACKGWQVYKDTPHLAEGFDQMAVMLAAGGADPFTEFRCGDGWRTIFEELEGAVPPRLKAWMAAQPFDLHVSPSNTMITQKRMS